MELKRFFTAVLALSFIVLPAVSRAEIKTGVLTVSPMIGGITMEGDQQIDSEALAYSLGLGYNFTQNLGLEAVIGGANLEEDGGGDVDFWNYRLDALYHFMPDSKLVPYVAAGLGGYTLGSDDEFMADYGAGLLYFLGENVALRADVRHMLGFNESNLENNIIYTAGFKFQFAGTKAPPKKEPADRDGDGVTDDLDQCPDTPKGALVDEKGCELKLTLHINFDFDKAVIKPEFKGELDKAAAFVRANANVPYILLTGHTDSKGNDAYNMQLSMRRAEAVRQALINDYGLDAAKLKAKGMGETQPVASNETEDGRYQNRRVELVCCAVLPE